MLGRKRRKAASSPNVDDIPVDVEVGSVRIIRPTHQTEPRPGGAGTDVIPVTGNAPSRPAGGHTENAIDPGFGWGDEDPSSTGWLGTAAREPDTTQFAITVADTADGGPSSAVPAPASGRTASSSSPNIPGDPEGRLGSSGGTDPLFREAAAAAQSEPDLDRTVGASSAVRIIIGDEDTEAAAVAFDPGVDDGGDLGDQLGPGDVTNAAEPGRRTVVINDDGASAVSTEPATTARRGMDPRFRERRKAVRRALGRKRVAGLVVGLTVVLAVVIAAALLASNLFAVRASKVTVTGWQYADKTQVDAVLDQLIGTPVLRVDSGDIQRQLEAIAWVETAAVDTALPNSATVELAERTPLSTFQGADGRYRILDRYGRVLDITDGFPVEFVWITSVNAPNLDVAEFAPAGFTAASELSRNFTATIRPRVQRIAVEPSGQALVLYLRDGSRVNFGAATDLFSKLVRLETLLTTYPEMKEAQIDVSTEETTRASDDLLKIKEAEREKAAAEAAAAEEAAAEEAAADAIAGPESEPAEN